MIHIIFLLVLTSSTYSLAQLHRASSKPHITGDSFRAIADHIFDDWTINLDPASPCYPPCIDAVADLNPAYIKPGDIIFTRLVNMEHFAKDIAPKISVPYILISHNQVHDYSAPGKYKYLLDSENLIAWFGQNCDLPYQHPKFIPIPIGLTNKHWMHANENGRWLKRFRSLPHHEKTTLLYANINITTNPGIRRPIVEYFSRLPFCTVAKAKSYPRFLQEMALSKFVLSPHGNGLDCHRTWEALYMGSFPVVKTSTLDPVYKDLPVLIVQRWEDVTQQFLEENYQRMLNGKYRYEKLYFEYWYNLIKSYQKPYRIV